MVALLDLNGNLLVVESDYSSKVKKSQVSASKMYSWLPNRERNLRKKGIDDKGRFLSEIVNLRRGGEPFYFQSVGNIT